MAESADDGPTLQLLFTEGWEAQKKVEAGRLSAEEKKVFLSELEDKSMSVLNSVDPQACVSKGITALEKATHLANRLNLFSSNEQVEEVSTADLK